MARLQLEIDEHVTGRVVSADTLESLPYLDAVIRESLRVRTIIPFVTRLLKAPFAIGERTYPHGVMVSPCIHLVHRREELYPDPNVFRPERFLERRFDPSQWLPFGGGNRLCLGMPFALFEMKVVLATMLANCRFQCEANWRSRVSRRGVVLAPDDGVQIRVHPC
ncbi:MAG: cytochrome P450 [Planctomycetales bacterium]|nr:cytochrome P450 [Planctomycetales bacterium]